MVFDPLLATATCLLICFSLLSNLDLPSTNEEFTKGNKVVAGKPQNKPMHNYVDSRSVPGETSCTRPSPTFLHANLKVGKGLGARLMYSIHVYIFMCIVDVP